MDSVVLNSKREFSLVRRHPWIFSGAIQRVLGGPQPGETVQVLSDDGEIMGMGAYSPSSQIRIRMWHFGDLPVTADFIVNRIGQAIGSRAYYFADGGTNAFRLVNAEADGFPGLVVDKYADWLVCQFSAAGAEYWKQTVVDALNRFLPDCKGIYERSDVDSRAHEGLEPKVGVLSGEEPPDRIEINEYGCRYFVDVKNGHKTGFYLDQRENRQLIKRYANGAEVLNAFSYTGGFGIAAMSAGAASVTHVDLSEPALELARENTALNECCATKSEFVNGNVFSVLRQFRAEERKFDFIVLDPPKFADSKGSLMRAARGYKDINLLGMQLLRPGGMIATFSCSGLMTPDLFHKVVSDAAVDAGKDFQVVARLSQSQDHPEGLSFPEGLYLKGLLLRVLG